MKYTLLFLALLAVFQVIHAQVEDIGEEIEEDFDEDLTEVEHSYHKRCLTPTLDGYLIYVNKAGYCPKKKPFGFELKFAFENNVDYFTFIVNICRKKHNAKENKILSCALRRAHKQCKTIGLPRCVTRRSQFRYRWKLVSDCLAKVLKKCSNGVVTVH